MFEKLKETWKEIIPMEDPPKKEPEEEQKPKGMATIVPDDPLEIFPAEESEI